MAGRRRGDRRESAPRRSTTGTSWRRRAPPRVRLRPRLRPSASNVLGSSRVSSRNVCALPSKPPTSAASSASARSPLCPNGGWPRSCARQAASTRSGSQPTATATSRPTWATSRVWVRRLRVKSSVDGPTTWVLAASRRSAEECTMRARSRSNGVRRESLGSARTRSTSAWSYAAGEVSTAATLLTPRLARFGSPTRQVWCLHSPGLVAEPPSLATRRAILGDWARDSWRVGAQ